MENKKKRNRPIKQDSSGAPRYYVKKADFYCPLSPLIMWHEKNLIYKECPLVPSERDMRECMDCVLKGESTASFKSRKKKRKDIKKVVKKEAVPIIGRTYTSE